MDEPESSRRQLGLFSATSAVIATMIGAGIWGTTGGFAFKLESDTMVLLVWLFCGLLALTGALSLGELGGMMPRAGGCYVFTRKIYGPTAGYLSGVLSSLLAFVGAMAFIAMLLGIYVEKFLPDVSPPLIGCAAILLFTVIHCLGLREGTFVNNTFTVFKVGVIIAFIVAGLSAEGRPVSFQPGEAKVFSTVFAAAMVSASFAYLGWETTTFIGGEVKNPGRILPWSLVIGTTIVIVLYLLINLVYLHAQAPADMWLLNDKGERQGISVIGPHASTILFGANMVRWFNGMVIMVLLSTISTITMVGARVLYAMAEEKQLPASLGKINSRQAPANALIVQGIATVLFILAANNLGTLGDVLDYIGLPLTIIMGATVAGVLVLRRREPDAQRPFRVPLYPLPPLLFIALALWMTVSVAIENWKVAAASAATVAAVWLLKPVLANKSPSSSA
jgi:APA family basic amino acid/polyamine antiporter